MANTIRILGLDPGLRRTGWGVIAVDGSRLAWIAHGVIVPDDKAPFSERLLHLFEGIGEIIEAHAPHEAAVEETFVNSNPQSTLKLGHARAAAMIAPAKAGLPVAEYAAREVKKCVVGAGGADKVRSLSWSLGCCSPPVRRPGRRRRFGGGHHPRHFRRPFLRQGFGGQASHLRTAPPGLVLRSSARSEAG